jgi:hypothetical protein
MNGFTARINEENIDFNQTNSNFNNGANYLSVTQRIKLEISYNVVI